MVFAIHWYESAMDLHVFPIPVHFSSVIPKMSMFTIAISCLTASNLPWFMDLTFQVPMQYCSLQHWTLLPSPVTSTAGHWFCFGSVSSFFLGLFLHSFPVVYWAPTDLENLSLCHIFLPFHTVREVLKARILKNTESTPLSTFKYRIQYY